MTQARPKTLASHTPVEREILLSVDDREVAQGSCLSIFLWPPFSALLFGTLLFLGLIRINFSQTISENSQASGTLAPIFTPQVLNWEKEIIIWASEVELDPNLVATVMQIESCGDPNAISPAGAMGLFQVMPYHFAANEDPYAPDTNAVRGLDYLRAALEKYNGEVGMALAGYNGGINGASRPQSEWAQETIDYKYWGENIYADAAAGRQSSPVLEEWLSAGGASLCAQAELAKLELEDKED
jgi:soluble lytic murein transglycosylase-like protein